MEKVFGRKWICKDSGKNEPKGIEDLYGLCFRGKWRLYCYQYDFEEYQNTDVENA